MPRLAQDVPKTGPRWAQVWPSWPWGSLQEPSCWTRDPPNVQVYENQGPPLRQGQFCLRVYTADLPVQLVDPIRLDVEKATETMQGRGSRKHASEYLILFAALWMTRCLKHCKYQQLWSLHFAAQSCWYTQHFWKVAASTHCK